MHKCEHCEKLLATKERYRRHIRTHTGDRPFKCSVCGKSFAENGNLNAHMKIHTNDKPHKCSYCNKSFIHNRTLKKHIQIHESKLIAIQEKTMESTTPKYTKDQLLAISLVAGTENYIINSDRTIFPTDFDTHSQTSSTSNDKYVVIVTDTDTNSSTGTEHTQLQPVKLTEHAQVSSDHFPALTKVVPVTSVTSLDNISP